VPVGRAEYLELLLLALGVLAGTTKEPVKCALLGVLQGACVSVLPLGKIERQRERPDPRVSTCNPRTS
jgi:hypothetical protein